jgi:hypothetical protein
MQFGDAVAANCSLKTFMPAEKLASADWQSAIQQADSLRYDGRS